MVGIVTRLWTEGRGFKSGQKQEIFFSLIPKTVRPDKAWGPHSFVFNDYWSPFSGDKAALTSSI